MSELVSELMSELMSELQRVGLDQRGRLWYTFLARDGLNILSHTLGRYGARVFVSALILHHFPARRKSLAALTSLIGANLGR